MVIVPLAEAEQTQVLALGRLVCDLESSACSYKSAPYPLIASPAPYSAATASSHTLQIAEELGVSGLVGNIVEHDE